MRKVIILSLIVFLMTACGRVEDVDNGKLKIVSTYSIAADMISNISKDMADVYSMVPEGRDPHMYEPLPKDIEAVSNADIIFYNGFNLETGGGWFADLLSVTNKREDAHELVRNVEAIYLTSKGSENSEDPHAWLDVSNAIKYVDLILEELIEIDPENADYYRVNHKLYVDELIELDVYAKEKLNEIDSDNRILVTSEGAFKYFAKAYDFDAQFIWEINTDNQGTPEQMNRIIEIVKSNNVKALFNESSVSPKTMEMVSEEVSVDIAAVIFTDSLAKKGEVGDTYISMMKWNIDQIASALK